MYCRVWDLAKKTATAFMNDGLLSRGAAVAFYTVTSMAPLLVIVIAIAGFFFGHDQARQALEKEFAALLGPDSAGIFDRLVKNANNKTANGVAAILGPLTLLITASGVFGEIQSSLNAIWKAEPKGEALSRLMKARIASLTLVAVAGFLLLISLALSAAITALSGMIDAVLPFGALLLNSVNNAISFGLLTFLIAAIYKILPDTSVRWGDVWIGAAVTSLLFVIGKSLIGLYIGGSHISATYGVLGAPIILLLWVYYSTQIFFVGAEFTHVYARERGAADAGQR